MIGVERIVVDLAAGDDRDLLVEQVHQRADDPRLRLAALAQEDDVLTARIAFSICGMTVSS